MRGSIKLLAWIRQHMCPDLGKPGATWNDTRVLIFTEYDDTKRYLQQQLDAAIAGSDRAEHRIAIYHGPTPPAQREEIKQAFNTDPAKHPVRILIATDAAREGLNLQAHCWNLFHFDVPWNPSRMEQRNGRIDRKLQPNPRSSATTLSTSNAPKIASCRCSCARRRRSSRNSAACHRSSMPNWRKTLRDGIRRKSIARLERDILAADLEAAHRQHGGRRTGSGPRAANGPA